MTRTLTVVGLQSFPRLVLGLAGVVASMLIMFTVPSGYFVPAAFFSTTCMVAVSYALGTLRRVRRPTLTSLGVGVISAAALYGIFYIGAASIDMFHPFGITSGSETSIYALIASPTNPLYLQVGVLLFDSAGYESFFRGVLQRRLTPRLGLGAAPAVALFDAGLHIATLNPVWVGATFVTDLVWGLTYHYGKGTQSSFTSHLIWDLAIFIVRPVV
jgi:membrane protease YdiL (CAAX protease family)